MSGQIPHKAIHVIVSGFVQGVGFRYFTHRAAGQLGLVGWVKNQYDGTVEIWAEGPENKLQQFIKIIERGPEHALVENVNIEWLPTKEKYSRFHINYR